MGSEYLSNPLEFIVHTLFGLYILVVMLRFLFQWVRADFYNPICQFLVKATNPLLRPLRRVIPGFGGIDLASIVLMLVLQILTFLLIFSLRGVAPSFGPLLMLSVAELVSLFLNVFLVAIIIQVILSWVNPGAYNPITGLLYSLTEPVLAPARRLVPPIGGLDLSPIVVLLVLQVTKMLIIPPLLQMARSF